MARVRDPEKTRRALLEAGFREIYRHGFQAASVDKILRSTRVTKGAFFHHFPNKAALGYAVVDEVIRSMIAAQWVEPLKGCDDPLPVIAEIFAAGTRALAREPENLGCPLNNLAQEMSPLDPQFRERTEAVFAMWRRALEKALDRGKRAGTVAADVSSRDAAQLIVALVEGTLSLAKNSQKAGTLRTGVRNMKRFLATLAP